MRVYHFINKEYGLEDLRERRLKIARIAELNDPFEFAAVNLSDPRLRQAWELMKQDMAERYGILCFSATWDGPVLWAHYADNHRGFCLGFDVPNDEYLTKVAYIERRIPAGDFIRQRFAKYHDLETYMEPYKNKNLAPNEFIRIAQQRIREMAHSDDDGLAFMKGIAATKFTHWSYEEEYRLFVALNSNTEGFDYCSFSEQTLNLAEIFVGCRSSVTRQQIEEAMGKMSQSVSVHKVRESDSDFALVRDERDPTFA